MNLQATDKGDPGFTSTAADAGAGGYGGVGGNGPGAPPSATQLGTLNGTPTADATVSMLYPYDGTVWPQGLLAPLLQWNPGAHAFDSVYVHIKEKNYEYQGYFAANKTPFVNLPIPQPAWDAATLSNGGEPLVITLVFAQGASVYGPYTESWTIAQAPLPFAELAKRRSWHWTPVPERPESSAYPPPRAENETRHPTERGAALPRAYHLDRAQ